MTGLAVIALLSLLIATYLLASRRYVWDAFLLLGLAVSGLLIVFRHFFGARGATPGRWPRLWPRTWAGWTQAMALALVLIVALAARGTASVTDYTFLLMVWLCAIGVFVATLVVPRLKSDLWHWPLSRPETWLLGALLLVAALLRVVALGRIPANLGGDEGTQLTASLNLIARPLDNPFATGWYSVPTMSFLAYGVAMRLFGATMAGGRALSALVGVLTVLTTFALGRTLGGRKAGWLAALVMTFSAYHIHYSRLASNQIFDPLIGTLSLWLVWRAAASPAEDPWREPAWGLAGVVAGLGWYGYFGARWVTVLLALALGWYGLRTPHFFERRRRGLLLFGCGWLIVTLPLLGWYATHPSALTERYNAVSIFASGWLAREMESTGQSAFRLLLRQFWKAATAFHLTPDPTFWYFPQRPLVDFVTGALLIVGMAAAVLRWKWPSRAVTLLWFWATLVMAWGLTENPPSSQRGLLLLPAAALLVAWGVLALEEVFAAWRVDFHYALGALLTLMAVLNGFFYFGVYTPPRVYGNPSAEQATIFAQFILAHPFPDCETAAQPAPAPIYLFGPPELYWDFGVFTFLLRDYPGVSVLPDEPLPSVSAPARFAFIPHRVGELTEVRALYPQGQLTEIRASDGRLLMALYDWPAEACFP